MPQKSRIYCSTQKKLPKKARPRKKRLVIILKYSSRKWHNHTITISIHCVRSEQSHASTENRNFETKKHNIHFHHYTYTPYVHTNILYRNKKHTLTKRKNNEIQTHFFCWCAYNFFCIEKKLNVWSSLRATPHLLAHRTYVLCLIHTQKLSNCFNSLFV